MTISRYRDDAALSLSKISKHVKTIRKHRRNKSEQKEFLKAFEKDFLDSVYMIVAARNVGSDEEVALNRLKIVHYNSARLCLEDIVKRKTKSWRKFKGNKDLFVDVTISQGKYDQYVGKWNAAIDILRKTKSYCDDDKLRSAGCFDGHVDELCQLFLHIDDLLSNSLSQRWWRSGLSCCKSLLTAFLLPISILVVAFIINRYIQGSELKEFTADKTVEAEERGIGEIADGNKGLNSNFETNKNTAIEVDTE